MMKEQMRKLAEKWISTGNRPADEEFWGLDRHQAVMVAIQAGHEANAGPYYERDNAIRTYCFNLGIRFEEENKKNKQSAE